MSKQQDFTAPYLQNEQQLRAAQPYPMQAYPAGQTTVVVASPVVQVNDGPVKHYLAWSIINFFLCPVLGLIAIIFSALSYNNKQSGNKSEARGHGQVAFGLNIAGTILGVIGWIISIVSLALTLSIVHSAENVAESVADGLNNADWNTDESTTFGF